ncbi:MAG TPA: PKD domain-containing protein, partial [Candidatus Limnocylindrales bacterium]|nr:PKD domain-containing protein [Candidatus Limnocylindrales bacterium]
SLPDEEVERRLGGRRRTDPPAAPRGQSSGRPRTRTTRGALLRDSSTLVGAALLAVVAFQVLSGAGPGATPGYSTPPGQTGVAVGSLGAGTTLPPLTTLGPIVNPGIHLEATPTPVPVITLPPLKPRARPTPKPTPRPTATTPPSVTVSCGVVSGQQVNCTATVAHIQSGSEVWAMGGAGSVDLGGSGSTSITFTYGSSGTYAVAVTVTGLNGSTTASDTTSVTV